MNSDEDKRSLRQRAEALHKVTLDRAAAEVSEDTVHELEVHRIELELQNEELQLAQSRLETSLARYRDLFDLAPVGYLTLDPKGGILNVNLTFASMLGLDREALARSNVKRLVSPVHQDILFRHLRMTFQNGGHQACELEFVCSDGETFFARLESIVEDNRHEETAQCLTVVTDITERRRQEQLIYHQANYDPLTELPNRSLFLDRLSYTMRTAQREHSGLTLFYIDLDNFKWVNDTYGHSAGDRVLVESARRFKTCARDSDTVARLSGDEFCILLPQVTNVSSATRVVGKVLAAMEQPFKLDDRSSVRVNCSVGIAMYPKDCDTPEALMQGADVALYQVKRTGRGHFSFFARELNEEILRRQRLGLDLKDAVNRGELAVRYQPVIELASGRPFGAEALVRWQHPEEGLLLPCDFVPIAEANGSINELGEWMLREVYRQAHRWNQIGIELNTLWVNLSARQCGNVTRASQLTTLLADLNTWNGIPRVGLEITESDVLDFSDPVLSTFAALHRDGVSLSIDDFGTGFSSLGRLLHLPFDIIKVDKSIIADVARSEKSANVVRAVIALGHSIDSRVVAEGIETVEQLDRLRELECDFGQGFHISEPMTGDELIEFLRTR